MLAHYQFIDNIFITVNEDDILSWFNIKAIGLAPGDGGETLMTHLNPYIIATFIVVWLLVTIYFIRSHYQSKKHNTLLIQHLETRAQNVIKKQERIEQQHKIAEAKSNELQSSVEYARHIQTSIMHNESDLKKQFPQAFAILESKGVVSGDFIWLAEKYDTTYLAVVDCTGHGVPGAFMSLIARSLLQEVILTKGVLNTSNILVELRQSLLESFNNPSSIYNCDGMDISLCAFNRHNNVLSFSGANQSIFIASKSDTPLENMIGKTYNSIADRENIHLYLLKGDRQPIGEHHGPLLPFTNYTVKLQRGDRFFAFTDGYRDQIGGSQNKRLKSHRFRNLILSSQHLAMDDMRAHLYQSFIDWKGSEDQIDDVCVLGVEL